jgi:GNAT superfamily N-acetyltransferase
MNYQSNCISDPANGIKSCLERKKQSLLVLKGSSIYVNTRSIKLSDCHRPAAYALYFFTYSTWAGRPSLFVEDLFVRAQFRRKGIGKAILQHLAAVAHQQNCYGMHWEVLDWNATAIDFYRSLGAKIRNGWLPVLLMGRAFEELASATPLS